MAERAGITKDYTRHFRLDEIKLRKLYDVLREHGQKLGEETYIRFYVGRENESFYETKDVEEILGDDNVPGKAITTLIMELHKLNPTDDEKLKPESERKPIAAVSFSRTRDEKVGHIVSGSNRDWCFVLADDLDTQIQRILTHKHYKLLTSRHADLLGALLFVGITAFALFYLIGPPPPPWLSQSEINSMTMEQAIRKLLEIQNLQSPSGFKIGSHYLIVLVLTFPIALVALTESRFISRLFSAMMRSVFYWGDMVAIQDRFEKRAGQVKWGIGIALVVSILGSVIAALLMK